MLDNILTHPSARITGIDVFSGPIKERYEANLERSGSAAKVTTIVGPSQVELRKLPLESFDIVYIDGSHLAADALEDAVLCGRLLKPGGLLIFDDYAYNLDKPQAEQPRWALDTYYQFYGDQFEVLHRRYQVVLKKKLPPPSPQ